MLKAQTTIAQYAAVGLQSHAHVSGAQQADHQPPYSKELS
jgi:hypothetical protein